MRRWIIIILFLTLFSISVNAQTIILQDNFNDGSITDWDQNSGTWSGASFRMVGANLDGGTISHSVVMPAGNSYQLNYRNDTNAANLNNHFGWFTDQNGLTNFSGYRLILQSGNGRLQRGDAGVFTDLFTIGAHGIGTFHDVNITHSSNGVIIIRVDGDLKGVVTDTTYTTGTKVLFATTNVTSNGIWDDLNITTTSVKTITVLRPIDEKTLLPIDKNWSAQLLNGNVDYQDANNNQKLFTATIDANGTNDFIVDDSNTTLDEYYPRGFSIKIGPSDTNSYILQPYLARKTDSTQVTFILWDKINNVTLSNYLITSRHSIDTNANALIESAKTNAAGTILFSFINGLTYDLTVADINGERTYFPESGESGQYNNGFSSYNIYISPTVSDVNFFVFDWNIFIQPSGETILKSASQRFDANVYTNYADTIQVRLLDGNVQIANSIGTGDDFNFTTTIQTNSRDTNFLVVEITIINNDRRDKFIQTFRLVDTQGTLFNSIQSFGQNTGIFGALILTLSLVFITLQNFGASITGNNESQFFLVGIILIISGLLFFPTGSFFIIITALTLGAIMYLQQRT